MAKSDADRSLLFGILALQNGLIDQDALIAAFRIWSRDKGRTMADHLVGRGDLDAEQRALLEGLVAQHLRKHGGDAEKSLAAIPAGRSTRERLGELGDAELNATLMHVGSGSADAPDADRTTTYAVGSATAEGRRFRVLRPHAQGGLGAVFVALDTELHREVALKQILDRHADDATSRQRFLLEAEITGGLEHPGIVPIYGLGTYADGRPYYAMRFIRGDSLKEAIDRFHAGAALDRDAGRRSLELRKLLRRFTDVCNAIDYAHGRGVLHRDIKPGNVIVGRHGETLVVDWGLAKATGRAEPGSSGEERPLTPSSASGSSETLPGSALGTPAYMSPEQAVGDVEHLGPQSDVYSLGATLYSLLTGKAPFAGEDLGSMLRAVQEGRFPPPRTLNPSIDRALEAVCLKAMQRKPADRYVSPRALSEDIDRWLADEPVEAHREPVAMRLARWGRRHKTRVAAAVALMITAMVALAISTILIGREKTRADRERARAEAGFHRAFDAVDRYYVRVSESRLLNVPGMQPLRRELLETAGEFYEQFVRERRDDLKVRFELGASLVRLAQINNAIGSVPHALLQGRQALEIFRALAAVRPKDAAIRERLGRTLDLLAYIDSQTGRAKESAGEFREAVAIFAALVREHPGNATHQAGLAAAQVNLANELHILGRLLDAEATYRDFLAISEKAIRDHPNDDPMAEKIAGGLTNAGNFFEAIGKQAEALKELKRAAGMTDRLVRRHPEVAGYALTRVKALQYLGDGYRRASRMVEAESASEEGLRIAERLASENPAVTEYRDAQVQIHLVLSLVHLDLGSTDRAEAALLAALKIQRRLVDEHPEMTEYLNSLAMVHNNLGALYQPIGKVKQAEAAFKEGIALYGRLNREHPEVPEYANLLAGGHSNLSTVYFAAGRLVEAEASSQKALTIRERLSHEYPTVSEYREDLGSSHFNLSAIFLGIGRVNEALSSGRAGLKMYEGMVAQHPEVPRYREALAKCHNNLANVLAAAGKNDEAETEWKGAYAIYGQLAKEQPGQPGPALGQAMACTNLAMMASGRGRVDDVLAWSERALPGAEELLRREPRLEAGRNCITQVERVRAPVLEQRGRHAEALRAWDRAVEYAEGADRNEPRLARAHARACGGDHAGAMRDAEELAKDASLPAASFYDLACVAALAAGPAAATRDAHGARAMQWLARAAAGGFFRDPAKITLAQHDQDLDSLRTRADFQVWLTAVQDHGFPNEPFAR